MEPLTPLLGLVVLALGVWAVARQVEVRLALPLTALALGLIAGQPHVILRTFLATFADEKFVVPICTSMGFAYVLRHTGCDRHLVYLLVRPLKAVRPLLVPGTVVVGFLVNMPIVSQTSTLATLGPVVLPILRVAGVTPVTSAAALLLGSSIGGELLNPGAPETLSVIKTSKEAALAHNKEAAPENRVDPDAVDGERCLRKILPLDLLALGVATLVFWALSLRHERATPAASEEIAPEFQVNPLRAMIPLVPLVLLYLTMPPWSLIEVPADWLEVIPPGATSTDKQATRLIGMAMLVGTAVAAVATPRLLGTVASAFCEGAGYGFTHIISLIVSANCLGQGITVVGLAKLVTAALTAWPNLLLPLAGLLSWAFAVLCGSGMATTQSLFPAFGSAAFATGLDPALAGAVVSLAAAAGRTMSPVAAVTLLAATLTGTSPLALVRRLALPLVVSTAAVVVAAMAWG